MLLEKYQPKLARDILGNYGQISSIREWLAKWKKGSALLVYGPTGCGKSLSVKLVAREAGFDTVESHASDYRGKAGFEELLLMTKQGSVFGKKKILLIEDIELVESRKSLYSLINSSSCPVVLVSEQPQTGLMRSCTAVRFNKVDGATLLKFLKKVSIAEGVGLNEPELLSIVNSSGGDVRAALIDMEFMSAGSRERATNVFEVLRAVFRDEKQARELLEDYAAFETLVLWVSSNLTEELKTKEELSSAYDYLSKADVIRARISRRQSWGLQKYVVDLILNGIAASRTARPRTFVSYRNPWITKKVNEDTLKKIAAATHVSKRGAPAYLPVMKALINDEELRAAIDFDEGDVAFLKKY
jgi:replication factor C large subunit